RHPLVIVDGHRRWIGSHFLVSDLEDQFILVQLDLQLLKMRGRQIVGLVDERVRTRRLPQSWQGLIVDRWSELNADLAACPHIRCACVHWSAPRANDSRAGCLCLPQPIARNRNAYPGATPRAVECALP